MCGLVGVAGNMTLPIARMFRDMLLMDTVRGIDSTGIAAVQIGSDVPIVEKELGLPDNLWCYGSEILTPSGSAKQTMKCLIGHNRAATAGAVNAENAHPFTFGNITGAHNGTLTYYNQLAGAKDFDVDSMAIFNDIDLNGLEHTWNNFYGAAALTYWDASDQTLNIIRNNKRPLTFAWSKDQKTLFWASEAWMIRIAASKANVELHVNSQTKSSIHHFPEDTHYKFDVTAMKAELASSEVIEKKTTALTPSTPTSTNGGGSKTTGFKVPHVTRHTSSKKRDKAQINKTWAVGLSKADKSLRGLSMKLVRFVSAHDVSNELAAGYALMELDSGERVEVYPENRAVAKKFKDKYESGKDYFFQLNYRPRVITNSTGKTVGYRVAGSGVRLLKSETPTKKPEPSLSQTDEWGSSLGYDYEGSAQVIQLYKGPEGNCTEQDFLNYMSRLVPKQCCSGCNQTLSIEDHKEYHWANKDTVFCPDCKGNTEFMAAIYYENRM